MPFNYVTYGHDATSIPRSLLHPPTLVAKKIKVVTIGTSK